MRKSQQQLKVAFLDDFRLLKGPAYAGFGKEEVVAALITPIAVAIPFLGWMEIKGNAHAKGKVQVGATGKAQIPGPGSMRRCTLRPAETIWIFDDGHGEIGPKIERGEAQDGVAEPFVRELPARG